MDRSTNHALRCGNSLGKQGKVKQGAVGVCVCGGGGGGGGGGGVGGGGGTDRIACIVRLAHGKHRVSNKNTATRLGPIRLGKPGVGPGERAEFATGFASHALAAAFCPQPSVVQPRSLQTQTSFSLQPGSAFSPARPKWLSFTVGDGDLGGGGGGGGGWGVFLREGEGERSSCGAESDRRKS